MGLKITSTKFMTNGTTGSRVISLPTGFGTPQAIIIHYSNENSVSMFDTYWGAGHACYNGAAYKNFGAGTCGADNLGSSNVKRGFSTTYSIYVPQYGAANTWCEGEVTAFGTDSVTFNFNKTAAGFNIIVTAINGLDNVDIGGRTSAGTISSYGSFQPNTTHYLSNNYSSAGVTDHFFLSEGWMDSSGDKCCQVTHADDNNAINICASGIYSGYVAGQQNYTAKTWACTSSHTSSGVTLSNGVGTLNDYLSVLMLKIPTGDESSLNTWSCTSSATSITCNLTPVEPATVFYYGIGCENGAWLPTCTVNNAGMSMERTVWNKGLSDLYTNAICVDSYHGTTVGDLGRWRGKTNAGGNWWDCSEGSVASAGASVTGTTLTHNFNTTSVVHRSGFAIGFSGGLTQVAIGSTTLAGISVGSSSVTKVMVGSTQIWG